MGDVTALSQSWYLAEPIRWILQKMPLAITMRAQWRLHLLLSRIIAIGTKRALKKGGYDVVFCAYSFHSLLNLHAPNGMQVVYTSDATPMIYKNSEIGAQFGSYLPLSRLIDPLILRAERKVFQNTDLLLWPTDWLKNAANTAYDLNPAQSKTVPWGANIADPKPEKTPLEISAKAPINLLLVGRDWWAKGGPIAYQTLMDLRDQGYDARLCVIGCEPPPDQCNSYITVHPNLDKSNPSERAIFEAAYRDAHFMVMASYESFGFAFCEASAFGLPSLCLRVGGVPIRDNVNGHALPIGTQAPDFANKISEYIAKSDAYRSLRITTRKEYEDVLNWDAWGKTVAQLLAQNRA